MCWWPQKPDEERQWAEPDDLTIVTALPHNPASRERFDEGVMEAVKTQYLPETRAFEVQSANPRRTPSTPQKRPNSSGKILELTPLWEQILRYNRLPQNVEKVKVFAELAMRLSDPEWEVRQHAMRVLVDLIPVIPDSNNDLDALMIPVVLTEVTYNLEHPAPAVRKSALDVLSTYIKYSSDPEFVLRSVVSQGLESPAANSNLAMSVLICIPPLLHDLQSVLTKRNQSFSHQSLVQIVTALSKKLVQNSFQQKTIDAMVKIRELVGETRFDHFLESYYPQVKRDFDVLCKVFEVRSSNSNLGDSGIDIQPENTLVTDTNDNDEDDWSDNETPLHRSSNVTSSTSTTERSRFELSKEELQKLESNSKLFSRTETDSNADSQEKRDEDAVDEEDYAQSESDVSMSEQNSSDTGEQDSKNDSHREAKKKQQQIDDVFGEMTVHDNDDSVDILDDGRVVMETEIKFNSETAITMTILEEKNDEGKLLKENTVSLEESEDQGNRFTNDFVMHVVEDDENSLKRTPRRVRFGGEVVKLRTPDSDVTIEIHEVDPKETPVLKFAETKLEEVSKEPPKTPKKTKTKKKVEDLTISGKESILYSREDKVVKRPRSSHIPLPIVPALSRPQLPWRKKPEQPTEDEDSSIPNCDGGESLTSGSEGEHPPPRSGFRDIRVAQEADEWQRLGFIDQGQLENLVRKDDWRARVRALDKLTTSLRQPEVARFVSVSSKHAGLSLLLFLLKVLHDDRSQRVACSSLRALRALVQALPVSHLLHELLAVVPGVCRHLGGGASVAVKLEAVEAVKTLMRTVRPAPIVEVLFSDKCFGSKSSRLRENSLLCLLYALMTFPSTEFPVGQLARRIMSAAVSEPRRRVRQAVLEALAALAQFIPSSLLRLDPHDYPPPQRDDVDHFNRAVQSRLLRKVLPSISPDGLILYSLHIPINTDNYSSNQNTDLDNRNMPAPSFSIKSVSGQGADADWVMAGTGVLSSGSARSRNQLDNAQRAFNSPTEQSGDRTQSWDNEITVAGVSVMSSKENYANDEAKTHQDTQADTRQTRPSYASMRPLYLNIQDSIHDVNPYGYPYQQDQGFPKVNATRRNYSEALSQTWPISQGKLSTRKLAILEPLDHQYQYGMFKVYDSEAVAPLHPHNTHPYVSVHPSNVGNNGNLPPLDWRHQARWLPDQQYDPVRIQDNQRPSRWSKRPEETHRRQPGGDRENGLRPVLSRQSKYPPPQTNGHVSPPPVSPARFISPSPSPLAPLPPPSPSPSPLREATLPLVPSSQSLQVEDLSGDNASASEEPRSRPSSQPKEDEVSSDHVDTLVVEEERLNTPPPVALPPPPPPPPPPEPEPEPETTQSEELTGEEKSSPLHQRRLGKPTGKQRLRATKGTTRDVIGSASPDVAPFPNPKEALNRCLQQLDHPEWEVTLQGLQTLVRLSCHHTTLLSPVLHQVVVAVTKHIRNLRSQVARVACKAATYLFTSIGRGIENEMDELCAVLLNRTADTNRFLRADCNAALDAMVDHVGSSRTVASIVNKGAKHQNAIVRATACRLLLRLCGRLGPERVLSLPRETRDAILNTGARSLTEGSLDTRRFAKEMFVLLSQDQRLPSLLTEVVPTTVMRSISKVLARLTAK